MSALRLDGVAADGATSRTGVAVSAPVRRRGTVGLAVAALAGATIASSPASGGDRPLFVIEQPTLMDLALASRFTGARIGIPPQLQRSGCDTEQCREAVTVQYERFWECRTRASDSGCDIADVFRTYGRMIFQPEQPGSAFARYAETAGADCSDYSGIVVCTYMQSWCSPPLMYFLNDDELIRTRVTIYVDPEADSRPIIDVVLDEDRRPIDDSEYTDCVERGQLPL